MSIAEKSGRPERDSDLRCQSGPSAKNSVIFSGGDSSKNYRADQQRTADFGSSFRQIPYTSYVCLLEDKIQDRGMYFVHNFLRKQCSGSKKWELVDSVDDLRSSSSIRSIPMPNFEVLDARIASFSPETKSFIIPSSKGRSVWRNKRPQKEDRFLRGRQIAYLIYEQFRVTGTDEFCRKTTPTCSLLFFEMTIFRNSIQSGTEILLSMTKIPPDDILEGLYKLRIRRV